MFFKRKPKNRRLGREQVLDVKVRSSQARATRVRLARLLVGGTVAVLLTGFLVWRAGVWAVNRWFYENPQFALQSLEIQTDGVIPVDKLRRWTGIRPGENLLKLDLPRVKRDLEMVSLIQSVSIERILPHSLRIKVTERDPIAQVQIPRRGADGSPEMAVFFVDLEGVVITPLQPGERVAPTNPPPDALPLILGVKSADIRPGRRIEDPQVNAALRLVEAFEHSSMAEVADVKRIEVAAPEVLAVTTGQGGEIIFALTDLEQQLRRWREIHDMGQRLGRAISTLDLAVTNHIPARWLDASVVLPAPVKPKPTRNAKKHV